MKKVVVAGKYSEVTLGEYCDYHLAAINSRSQLARITAITNLAEDEARELSKEQCNKIEQTFLDALREPTGELKQRITVGGTDFGLVPDFTAMKMGEYIDAVQNSSREKVYETLPKFMAIMYRPITKVLGDTYEVEPYDHKKHLKNADKMKGVSMEVANGLAVFFCDLCRELTNNLPSFLVSQMEQNLKMV